MTRPRLLVPALAIAALLVAAPAAAAAVDPKTLPAQTEFDLPANNGLHAHLDVFNEEFTLLIERRGTYARYEVDGEANENGLRARFGKLGVVDVAFHPAEVELTKPPRGCVGPPSRSSTGVLAGTISFIGEGEYVRIETSEVEARLAVWRESEWRCPRNNRRARDSRAPRPLPFDPRPHSKEKDPAILGAARRRCRCGFVAYSLSSGNGRVRNFFYGARNEESEGMDILRLTYADAGPAAFTFNHKAGTASVHPPAPFTGSGIFKRRPHSPDLWRSNLQVPFLGDDPIDMSDGDYRAALVKDEPEFR